MTVACDLNHKVISAINQLILYIWLWCACTMQGHTSRDSCNLYYRNRCMDEKLPTNVSGWQLSEVHRLDAVWSGMWNYLLLLANLYVYMRRMSYSPFTALILDVYWLYCCGNTADRWSSSMLPQMSSATIWLWGSCTKVGTLHQQV